MGYASVNAARIWFRIVSPVLVMLVKKSLMCLMGFCRICCCICLQLLKS